MYSQAVSLGFPLAYFKIAKMYDISYCSYKEEGSFDLYKKYLLMASEAGVVEAQHNLGVEYSIG